jgi:signal peptidase
MQHSDASAVRSTAAWLVDAALWLAAAAGATSIALVILAHTMGITIMMFGSGSMAPTIPTGSVALVQRTEASAIEVGDVVTVDREGQLPVTHRVTSIEPGGSDAERIITMRGDANEREDPHPYAVTSVRSVLWSAPGLAAIIARLGDPVVLGGLTIAAALMVAWAFWPRDAEPLHAPGFGAAPAVAKAQ